MATADKLIELFNEAKAKRAGAEREEFLGQACGADSELKNQVLSLLKAEADEGDSDFLKCTPLIRSVALISEKVGDRIGRYKLLQQLGEGGCGVVYMAEQEEPVRRRVALKVIKLGMDTRSVIARFEAERQALALMDHPNIAKVHDAGATETGRPFFVMELVRGIKITDYCDQNNLSTEQRLELFTHVCHAVQHAHQKGIIHRDIKPSNILVTRHDGVPVPKVIDFGVAKATSDQRLSDKTIFTAFEQFIGTPAYMSPEQAEMSGLDIDTRSDIYSLGVLLYELLTGKTPLDPEELLRSGMNEMRRKIREDEPPRPSTRLSTMQAADLTTIAKHRQADAPKLIHLVHGDLDWIVMKCLEKDRTRRYEAANGLAADIERYLSSEPIAARPPSRFYRLQKMVRRNKAAVTAATALIGVLAIGVAVSTLEAIRAMHAKREQIHLRQIAEANEEKAQTEAAKSKQVAQFLQDMLFSTEDLAKGRDTGLVREMLDRTAGRIGRDLTNQPEVAVELQNVIGYVYAAIREPQKAEAIARSALELGQRSLGNGHGDVAWSLALLSQALTLQGKHGEAENLAREALGIYRTSAGGNERFLSPLTYSLGNALYEQGRLPEAEGFFREALAIRRKYLGNADEFTAVAMSSLASTLRREEKFAEAESLYRECLAVREKKVPDAWYTFYTQALLGGTLLGEKKYAEAEPLLLSGYQGMKQREASIREPKVFSETLQQLIQLYQDTGREERAAQWRQQLEAINRLAK